MSLILDALKRSEQTDSMVSHAPADAHQSAGAMRTAAGSGGAVIGCVVRCRSGDVVLAGRRLMMRRHRAR